MQVFEALDADGNGCINGEDFDLSHVKQRHERRSAAASVLEVAKASPDDDADLPDLDTLPSLRLAPRMTAQYSHLNESFGEMSGGGGTVDSRSAEKTFASEDESLNDGAIALDETCNLLCHTLGLQPGEALLLLVAFDFDRERAVEAFLRDAKWSRQALGLPSPGAPLFLPQGKDRTCQICFDDTDPPPEVLPCGHRFCSDCWTQALQVGVHLRSLSYC